MNNVRFLVLIEQKLPSGAPKTQSIDLLQEADVNLLNQMGFKQQHINDVEFYGFSHSPTSNIYGHDVYVTLMKDHVREAKRGQPVDVNVETAGGD